MNLQNHKTQLCKNYYCTVILINQATIKDFNSKQEIPVLSRYITHYSDLSAHFIRERENRRKIRVTFSSTFIIDRGFSVEKKGLRLLKNVE